MSTQFYAGRDSAFEMVFGQPMHIDRLGGEFSVRSGEVWLTRRGDLEDHVLGPGQHMSLRRGDSITIEQWRRDQPAILDWHPQYPGQRLPLMGLARDAAALALRGVAGAAGFVAGGLRRAEAGFAALARRAASMARRAQGCICAGDSMASAGTVQ